MILLKIGSSTDIKGKSPLEAYKDCIAIKEMMFSVGRYIEHTSAQAQRQTNIAYNSELVLVKDSDMSSPYLWLESIKGVAHDYAYLYIFQTAGQGDDAVPFLTLQMQGAIISQYSARSRDARPEEHFQINFTGMKYDYVDFDGEKTKTSVGTSWNFWKHVEKL